MIMKRYRHYKGTIYEVLCVANHSETGEKLVIYKNSEKEIYARPYNMFFGLVSHDGESVPRFIELNEESSLHL